MHWNEVFKRWRGGMTQAAAALVIRVHPMTLSRIERGELVPSLELQAKLVSVADREMADEIVNAWRLAAVSAVVNRG